MSQNYENNFKKRISVEEVDESLKEIEKSFQNSFDKLDGISYFDDDYWFNVRGSNTEPKLRLNAEAER